MSSEEAREIGTAKEWIVENNPKWNLCEAIGNWNGSVIVFIGIGTSSGIFLLRRCFCAIGKFNVISLRICRMHACVWVLFCNKVTCFVLQTWATIQDNDNVNTIFLKTLIFGQNIYCSIILDMEWFFEPWFWLGDSYMLLVSVCEFIAIVYYVDVLVGYGLNPPWWTIFAMSKNCKPSIPTVDRRISLKGCKRFFPRL